jgi:lysophospholipase L1-like esterase
MPDPILPVAPDSISTTTDLLPILNNSNPPSPSGSSTPISLQQAIGAVQTATSAIVPLGTSAQNAVSTTPDLLPPKLDVMLVSDDGFSGGDRVTSNPDITGMVSDNIGVDRLLGRFTGQANFVDIKSTLQADGKFTIDRQRLSQISGKALTDGAYQFEVQAVDLAGNVNTKGVQFTLENPLQYSFKVNDSEITTGNEVNKFKYTGTWNLANESNAYGNNAHWTNDQNASYEVKFYGSQAQLFSVRNPWGGIAGISVDGGPEKLADTYGTDWKNQAFFKSDVLETGLHTIKVRVTGQKNAASGDHMISIDRLDVLTPNLNSSTGTADLTDVASANNKSLLFSPYGWGTVENGVQTSNAGAYIKFRFNGSQATLNVDTTNQTSFPLLDVYVDGKQTGDQLWLKNANNGQIKLFGGGAGDHDVVVYFRRRELFDGTNATVTATKQQDWLTDAEHLRVTGVQVNGGSGFLNNSFARSKTAVFFGDSITEGGVQTYEPNAPDRPANFPFTDIVNNFSYKTYAARLGDLLNVEYGQVGWSGSGWIRPSAPTGNPPVLDSWLRYNGQSTAQRNFSPQPDYVFMNLGTNDIPFNAGENNINFNVTNTAYTWLKEARQRIPGAEIFVIYPFNQTKNAELRQAIVRYLNENPGDTKVHALNLGAEGAKGLVGPYIAEFAVDSVHPTASRHQQLAGFLHDKIKPIIGVSSTIIEDTSTASATGLNTVKYTGTWRNEPLPGSLTRDSYLSNDLNATYEVTFRGDRIRLFGNKDSDNGIAAISIDGGQEVITDLFSSNPLNDALLYQSGTLGNGFHTIKVRVTGQKSTSSIGTTVDIGKLEVF